MKGKDIVYDALNITIAIGQTNFNENVTLRDGVCIGAEIKAVSNRDPEHFIDVGVTNSQNRELISSVDFRTYERLGGAGYLESLKQCSFETRGQVNVVAVADQAIAGSEFKAQIVFAIDQNPCKD